MLRIPDFKLLLCELQMALLFQFSIIINRMGGVPAQHLGNLGNWWSEFQGPLFFY